MRGTLARRVSRCDYPRPDWVGQAARRLGLKAESLHQATYGPASVFQRAAVIVEELVRAGRGAQANRLLCPVDRARDGGRPRPLDAQLCQENKDVEQAEDRAELAFCIAPDVVTARTWYEKLKRETAHNLELMRALKAHYEF